MKLSRGFELVRWMGLGWVLYRAAFALQKKTGILRRRFPTREWERLSWQDWMRPGTPATPEGYRAFREASETHFFFPLGRLPDRERLKNIATPEGVSRTVSIADDYCSGRFLYFSAHLHDLGHPVRWLFNPFQNVEHHADVHWTDYPTFSAKLGDIKEVWEPSRFAGAYYLARAYAFTGDEKYPAAFWSHFETWCEANPPNRGPNWKCGQECAMRVMAWCFGLHAFWTSKETTPQRIAAIVRMLAMHAERIARNIDFAISQRNNHSTSEAVGIMTVGMLFPEFKESHRWANLGRSVVENDIRRLIYSDGSFSQQSMNYHRVMLHDCLWALRLAEVNHEPFSYATRQRLARAGGLLFEMLDEPTGRVPNYGANDGALVLPLAACDYLDFRPTIQAARYGATGFRVLPSGPWDEMLVWLFGEKSLRAEPQIEHPKSRRFDAGGYNTIRGRDSWAIMRAHTYRDRPAHVDMLHVDAWHKGVNVLGDSGTYKYFTPESPGLDRYFKDIASHNAVQIDDRGPLELYSRFLWLPWPRGRCLSHGERTMVGEHEAYEGYPTDVVHRRSVSIGMDESFTIVDELLGRGQRAAALRWHLADAPFEIDETARRVVIRYPRFTAMLSFEGPAGLSLSVKRGVLSSSEIAGWVSDYYRAKSPRPTVVLSGRVTLPARLVTMVNFKDASTA